MTPFFLDGPLSNSISSWLNCRFLNPESHGGCVLQNIVSFKVTNPEVNVNKGFEIGISMLVAFEASSPEGFQERKLQPLATRKSVFKLVEWVLLTKKQYMTGS